MNKPMVRMGVLGKTVAIAATVFLFFVTPSLYADEHRWTGDGGNNNWSTPDNWLNDLAPSSEDNLYFGVSGTTPYNDLEGYTFVDVALWTGTPVILSGNAFTLTGTLKNWSGANTINNDIILSGSPIIDLTNLATNDVTFNGEFSGSGNFYKTGANKMYLNTPMAHTGSTTLNYGFLYPGDSNIFPDATDMIINDGGKLMMESYSDTVGSLTLNGGTIQGDGTLTSTSTINVGSGGSSYISMDVAGTSGLTVTNGAAYVWHPVTYTGLTTVDGGSLSMVFGSSFPSSFQLLLKNSGSISMSGATLTASSVTVENGSISGSGTTLICDAGFDVESGLVSGGYIGGTGDLRKTTSGTFSLYNPATYTGDTLISAGTLRYYTNNALSDQTDVVIADGAVLYMYGYYDTVGSVSGEGDITLAGSNAHLITGANNTSEEYSGIISEIIQPGSKVTKIGSGNWTLSGTNTYTGATTVSAGTLTVNGSISDSATTVSAGASLKGSGTVGPLTLNGTIAPGNSIGTMNINGNTSWDPGGAYEWEIDDAEGSAGSAPGWDLQSITGILDITATDISPFSIDITSLDGIDIANFNNTSNYTWLLASASGGVTGFDVDKFELDYSAFTNDIGAGSFSIENDTNDINLKFTGAGGEVPEPSTFLLLLPLLFFLRRFLKKK